MNSLRLKNKKSSPQEFALIVGIILFAILIVRTNYSGNAFYNFDMYSDQLYARLVSEEGTVFPSDWVFGNQYYVIATPVLAGLLNTLIHNSFISMATASTLMFLLTLTVFAWSFYPFLDRLSLLVAMFCLSGAAVLGDSASSHIAGFQLFYTMASYYACYVIGILYTVGIWFRLRNMVKVGAFLWFPALAAAMALGMQSLRETLVLYIPLTVLEVFSVLKNRKVNRLSAVFTVSTFISNVIGLIVIRYCPVNSSPIIGEIMLDLHPAAVSEHFRQSVRELYQMTGVPYLFSGWKWKILGVIGLLYTLVAVSALIAALIRKEQSAVSQMVKFCAISIGGVLLVGSFLFRVRDIYYFVWVLLVVSAFAYLFTKSGNKTVQGILLVSLLLSGAVNLFYNFYPDYVKQKELDSFYSSVAKDLSEKGITKILVDMNTPPAAASVSGDRITAVTYTYNNESETQSLLKAVPFLQAVSYVENIDPEHTLIILSDYLYSDYSSIEYLELFTSEEYRQRFFDSIELVDEQSCTYVTLYFYRFSNADILESS